LSGVVVNNGIILVDYVNLLRVQRKEVIAKIKGHQNKDGEWEIELPVEEENELTRECILDGASSRLRPILITTLTTLLGDIPMAVATASSKVMYEPCLKNNGIYYFFDHICDVKKFKDGKNTPELFLYVANLLGVKPNEILIFEDTLHAIKVALEAGFNVCSVYEETCKDEDEKKNISSLYIKDFNELL
jgi:HAD superfamily hydrolase (TIGR01509 family)